MFLYCFRARVLFTGLLLLALSGWASAAQIDDLYRVAIPVQSQNQADREQAMTQALSQVVVKVTGQRQSLTNSGVQSALRQASRYVQGFSYRTEERENSRQLVLQVRFDEPAVNRLLRENGQGIWGENRPDTLLWLAVEKNGIRRIQRGSPTHPVVSNIESTFSRRALPVTFPLMDFEDELAITPVDVWGMFTNKLEEASARYGSKSIVGGRLAFDGEKYNGRIVLLFQNQRFNADIVDLTEKGLALAMADLVGNALAQHYAVRSDGQAENPMLSVEGVQSTKDYAGVVNYLKNLTAVRDVTVRRVKASTLELELEIDGTVSQLVDAIALGRKLRRNVSVDSDTSLDSSLRYQWQGR